MADEIFFTVAADSAVAMAAVATEAVVVLEAAEVTEWANSALVCKSKIGVCLHTQCFHRTLDSFFLFFLYTFC